MRITLEVSEDNEATESPWWFICDPRQNMRADLAQAAMSITGPFFSRKEAEDQLKATRYNYGPRAAVWCGSGYHSYQYKTACRNAVAAAKLMAGGEMLDKTLERVAIESPVHGPVVAEALRRLLSEKMKREHDIKMALTDRALVTPQAKDLLRAAMEPCCKGWGNGHWLNAANECHALSSSPGDRWVKLGSNFGDTPEEKKP